MADVQKLMSQLGMVARSAPTSKTMTVRVAHSMKPRRLTWHDPCEPAALDAMLRGKRFSAPVILSVLVVCFGAFLTGCGDLE